MKFIEYLEMIINNQEIDENILYDKPSLFIEIEELERTAKELGYNVDELIENFKNGELIKLSKKDWKKLKNTDSNEINSIEDIQKLAIKYHKNFNRVYDQIVIDKKIEAPIVLYRKRKAPYLIGGNTRLMTIKSLGLKPIVWAIQEP
jgi:hypothetical protein